MRKKIAVFVQVILFFSGTLSLGAQTPNKDYYKNYLKYEQLKIAFDELALSDNKLSVQTLTESAGGKKLFLFKAETNKDNPAIFVGANISGVLPIASSGALYLADYLKNNPGLYKEYTWYILPCANPDAYFNNLRSTNLPFNNSPVNNDMDDLTDEDGMDDLNEDGLFSNMRVKDPLGSYVIDTLETRLLKKTTAKTPAEIRYKLLTEGIDNDGDGNYNEDAKGGVNIGHSFPYNFKYHQPEYGKFSGSEKETRALLEFFSDHKEVCMVVTLGKTDFLRNDFIKVPKTNKEKTYKLPKRIATQVGVSPAQSFTMEQLIKLIGEFVPERKVDESFIHSLIGVDPLKEPLAGDALDYQTISKSFKANLKSNKFKYSFVDAIKPTSGEFETYAYYHLGLPSMAMRLWDVPNLQADSVKKKQTREKAFLVYNDSILKGAGFVDWTKVTHPDFEHVEVGGCINSFEYNPLDLMIENTLASHIPWLGTMPEILPQLSVYKVESEKIAKSTYRIEVFLKNDGKISAPLEIGKYTRMPAPIVLVLEDEDVMFLEGKPRTLIEQVKAGQVKKYSFLINTAKADINIDFVAKNVKTKSSNHQL